MTTDLTFNQLPVRESVANNPSLNSFRLSVLVPVYNERHVVEASLRRVLALKDDLISSLKVIVDDQSTDGTWAVLERLAAEDHRVALLRNDCNLGKGAALRKAIARSTAISVSFMTPISNMIRQTYPPCFSRSPRKARMLFSAPVTFLHHPPRTDAPSHHDQQVLTSASNWLTDLNLTDLETCYKAVKTDLLKSIPLRSNDFRFEVELTFKLAKRRAAFLKRPFDTLPEAKRVRKYERMMDYSLNIHDSFLVDRRSLHGRRVWFAHSFRAGTRTPVQLLDGQNTTTIYWRSRT